VCMEVRWTSLGTCVCSIARVMARRGSACTSSSPLARHSHAMAVHAMAVHAMAVHAMADRHAYQAEARLEEDRLEVRLEAGGRAAAAAVPRRAGEQAAAAAMSLPKPVVKMCDMPPDMEQAALTVALEALESLNSEKEVAQYVRDYFVKKYNGVWHCVVGRNFGSYVTHEAKHHIYFYTGQTAVLLFKTN